VPHDLAGRAKLFAVSAGMRRSGYLLDGGRLARKHEAAVVVQKRQEKQMELHQGERVGSDQPHAPIAEESSHGHRFYQISATPTNQNIFEGGSGSPAFLHQAFVLPIYGFQLKLRGCPRGPNNNSQICRECSVASGKRKRYFAPVLLTYRVFCGTMPTL
jgi:hypothetical protein